MNDITKFHFNDHKVRTVIGPDGEPWFVAKDVCGVLDITNPGNVYSRLNGPDIRTMDVRSSGQIRQMQAINESGLYDLIFDSRKPEAKEFRHWVTSEVLPSIRKTGKYEASSTPLEQRQISKIDYEMGIIACEALARMLLCSKASKVNMISTVCQNHGIQTNFLPPYVDDQADGLGLGSASISELIKEKWEEDGEMGKPMSAMAANTILIGLGLLENRTKEGKIGCWKAFTEKGLKFGKNRIYTGAEWKSQPCFYRNMFPEVWAKIKEVINGD